ncbi:unnamed protein product [Larinioides sclopetarius]|uniref:Granulin n=1 Tax=Larinioides sclopetarius TaxID=280406 RepID=A0AAV2B2V8_9ARAC
MCPLPTSPCCIVIVVTFFTAQKAFVLLVFIPSFIAADILCPKSKTTCPKDKKCCEVDGEYSCCDSDVDQKEQAKVDAAVGYENSVPFVNMSYPANESEQIMNCQFPQKSCGNHCCGLTDVCCGSGCCRLTDTCCGHHCCRLTDSCCGRGCCRLLTNCCGNHCC